jgi:uncharacterized protein (DUF362 family)
MSICKMKDMMYSGDMRRRGFLARAAAGVASVALGAGFGGIAKAAPSTGKANVGVTAGTDRRAMVYNALKPFEDEVRKAVKGRRIILKPNMVVVDVPLCATHADALRGVLDFLKPIVKDEILIAESTISKEGSLNGFENYGYMQLAKEYRVSFMDLNTRPSTMAWILGKDHHPLGIRIINEFLDPKNYFISVCRLKTHDTVVATLTAKNMLMAAPLNDYTKSDKSLMHQGFKEMNWNLFQLASGIRPGLAVLDGVEGMQGNGPVRGISRPHGVVAAGTDFIAVDLIGTELMGIPFEDVGYLTYCANAGYGCGDRSKIEIIGEDPAKHVVRYKLHDTVEEQLSWKK